MRICSLLVVFLLSFIGNAQDYFPKNDGVKQSFKNHVAITHATIYVSPTQKLENATNGGLYFVPGPQNSRHAKVHEIQSKNASMQWPS